MTEVMSSGATFVGPIQRAYEMRKESEDRLRLLQAITSELATATDLSTALKIVVRHVCEKTGWQLGVAWLPNHDRSALHSNFIWAGDTTDLKEFQSVTEKTEFKRGMGLPGRVWKSKEPAWVEDVTNDPNFPRAPAARTAGLITSSYGLEPAVRNDHQRRSCFAS